MDNDDSKNNNSLFARLGRINYSFVNDSMRDNWYPYRNIKENNVTETVKKAKEI